MRRHGASMRTRLVDENGDPKYTNRLIDDSSPYLVQHAHNPVDWYPWGDEAFARAIELDKPVFLSIGYSTCHWCHVMEHESFDNEQVAEYLNEHFVSIKLDREQRPDIDEIYMTGLQLMTGQGGWPMSNFITADGKPFFAGTYFPPEQFLSLLQNIQAAWANQRTQVLQQAEEIADRIHQQSSASQQAQSLGSDVIQTAISTLRGSFDAKHGGFGVAPKFPNESQLWLFAVSLLYESSEMPRDVLVRSLEAMAQGGICDHLAGGFHRYSTDEKWLVPHFEKMLYNQSQLIRLYALGYQFKQNPAFLRVLKQSLEYLKREMTSDDGGFYSATDADSEGKEGTFFVWSYSELKDVLDPDAFELIKDLFGVTEAGNFEGKNVLHLTQSLEFYADEKDIAIDRVLDRVKGVIDKLYKLRQTRPIPFLDTKIIAAWNGHMISTLVDYELWNGDSSYRDMALNAAEALWQRHVDQPKRVLMRSRLGNKVSVEGALEDYAFVADAFLGLHLLVNDQKWFDRAQWLLDVMVEQFWDDESGGFFAATDHAAGPSIVRSKNPMDGATPSGNGVAMSALLAAFEASGNAAYKARLEQSLAAFSGQISKAPAAHPYTLSLLPRLRTGSRAPTQWAADGKVRVTVTRAANQLNVLFAVSEPWHLNHPDAESQGLLGLSITYGGKVLAASDYPAPELMDTDFTDAPVPVLTGEFKVVLEVDEGLEKDTEKDTLEDTINLALQVCSHEICLAPGEIVMRLPAYTR